MQMAIHVIERDQLNDLRDVGAGVPAEPWPGPVDIGRVIEGHSSEPNAGEPLVVGALTQLLQAGTSHAEELMRTIRRSLHDGRSYFEWKDIPVVFVVEGHLELHDGELRLEHENELWDLTPLFGRGMKQKLDGEAGWYWSPQIR
jgi:hypothetical protein